MRKCIQIKLTQDQLWKYLEWSQKYKRSEESPKEKYTTTQERERERERENQKFTWFSLGTMSWKFHYQIWIDEKWCRM